MKGDLRQSLFYQEPRPVSPETGTAYADQGRSPIVIKRR